MPRQGELRVRIARLISGEMQVDDLNRVMLWLRDRSFGRHTVRDVGDFAAHSEERNRGLVTDEIRYLAASFDLLLEAKYGNIAIDKLPSHLPEIVRGTIVRMDADALRQKTGLSAKDARRVLDASLRKYKKDESGILVLADTLESTELKVLELGVTAVVKPIFTSNRLWTDFIFVLTKNDLLQAKEIDSFGSVRPLFMLFTVWAMHRCKIILPSGREAYLEAASDKGSLVVRQVHLRPRSDGTPIYLSTRIFDAELEVSKWCDDGLNSEDLGFMPWDLEIGPGPILRRLVG